MKKKPYTLCECRNITKTTRRIAQQVNDDGAVCAMGVATEIKASTSLFELAGLTDEGNTTLTVSDFDKILKLLSKERGKAKRREREERVRQEKLEKERQEQLERDRKEAHVA